MVQCTRGKPQIFRADAAQMKEGRKIVMKILLVAINAKYIHSNPAVYSLRASAGGDLAKHIRIAEYTINNREEEILADIYRKKPDVLAFSCYIWNWQTVVWLLPELHKILPGVEIWLGGPEVSYNAEEILTQFPMLRGVMVGEGEVTLRELAEYYLTSKATLADIAGIVYRNQANICITPPRELTDLSKLPFLYDSLEPFDNRIIYYESSRGCPYRCSYCLSSIDKRVRFRDIDIVKRELQFFLDHKVKQVKFVDRTFNCNHEHAMEIWKYLSENDNGVTNFHFEIEADIISEEELALFAKVRPGLFQMEIGVQTFHPQTLQEIRRVSDMEKLQKAVEAIHAAHTIHVHLDLIAGLPYENYESFRHSFNKVYRMRPEQLQLGFLKVLKGSYMYEKAADYGIYYLDKPPYEVLSTKWLTYGDILRLKAVEQMVETFYNSNQFTHTMRLFEQVFADAFSLYEALARFYEENGLTVRTPSRSLYYQVLLDFAATTPLREKEDFVKEILLYDLYLRENLKSRPDFAKEVTDKRAIRAFYDREEKERKYLPDYAGYESRQLAKMTHMELFFYPVWEEGVSIDAARLESPRAVLFDYRVRDALTYEARTVAAEIAPQTDSV